MPVYHDGRLRYKMMYLFIHFIIPYASFIFEKIKSLLSLLSLSLSLFLPLRLWLTLALLPFICFLSFWSTLIDEFSWVRKTFQSAFQPGRGREEGGGGNGVPSENISRGVRPASQNPYPIYDQNLWFCLPGYLWPDQKFDFNLFMSWPLINTPFRVCHIISSLIQTNVKLS